MGENFKVDPAVDINQVFVQEWVESIQQHIHYYLMEQWFVDCLLIVEPEIYPQIDVAALVAALPDKEPKQEPRSADDVLFEPIQKNEPEPVKDDSVLDDYMYEGMSYMGSETIEIGCECNDCKCIG